MSIAIEIDHPDHNHAAIKTEDDYLNFQVVLEKTLFYYTRSSKFQEPGFELREEFVQEKIATIIYHDDSGIPQGFANVYSLENPSPNKIFMITETCVYVTPNARKGGIGYDLFRRAFGYIEHIHAEWQPQGCRLPSYILDTVIIPDLPEYNRTKQNLMAFYKNEGFTQPLGDETYYFMKELQ